MITQNRKVWSKEIKKECVSHGYNRPSSHLIFLQQFTVVVHHRCRESLRPVNCRTDLSPHSWGGNRGPSKEWGHFLCLQALAGKKIKCLHSVRTALFQMLPLPFKRPLWAWMANKQCWGYHSQFLFSLPLPPSILHHICDGNPKSLLRFYSKCESAVWYVKQTGRQKRGKV